MNLQGKKKNGCIKSTERTEDTPRRMKSQKKKQTLLFYSTTSSKQGGIDPWLATDLATASKSFITAGFDVEKKNL